MNLIAFGTGMTITLGHFDAGWVAVPIAPRLSPWRRSTQQARARWVSAPAPQGNWEAR